MKSVVLIYENAADLPQAALDRRTPLEVARCPAAARIVSEGRAGQLSRPSSRATLSAEACLAALCGVPAEARALLARGPLEAASMGLELDGYTHAYRADLVTLDDTVLRDGWLARLTLQETEQLAQVVQKVFDPARVRFVTRAPGRLLALVRAPDEDLAPGVAPWMQEGQEVEWPRARNEGLIREVLEKSAQHLARQTINDVRVDLGENPASAIWLWGGGPLARVASAVPAPTLVLTQSAMAGGLARLLGLAVQPLMDPWAATHPGDVVDADALRAALHTHDRLVVYVESPPELRRGPARERVSLLERMDVLLTQPLLDVFKRIKQRRVVLASVDAAVPAEADRRVPALVGVWGSHLEPDAATRWDEPSCAKGALADATPEDVVDLMRGA